MHTPTTTALAGRMMPTDYEKREWSRFAQAAYAADQNQTGHRFSAAASLNSGMTMAIAIFDGLQSDYRAWLIDGAFPATDPLHCSPQGLIQPVIEPTDTRLTLTPTKRDHSHIDAVLLARGARQCQREGQHIETKAVIRGNKVHIVPSSFCQRCGLRIFRA